ncbi:MAG: CDP-alcohol phosphatidyltransferase family protein [Oscillospiraceae bacterium]|jgi:cardiolipin synthase|nr:CDP-alcohol phosphatidyltransferase family protein [Oscillospiraceae bacterium]
MKQTPNHAETYKTKILTIPNLLSFFRICLIPVFIWLYCVRKNELWTGIVLILSGITDVADGLIARRFHMISDVGKALDPVADKLTQGAMLLCLISRFSLMLIPLLLMTVKEIYMGVAGVMVIRRTGNVPGADWHGKAATGLLFAMMILHIFWPEIPSAVSIVSVAACTVMVGISFVLYAMRNIRDLKRGSRKAS